MEGVSTGLLMMIVGLLALQYLESNRKPSKPINRTPSKPVGELEVKITANTEEVHRALGKVEGHIESLEAKIERLQEKADKLT